jgi:hypothetical protein
MWEISVFANSITVPEKSLDEYAEFGKIMKGLKQKKKKK